jgi:hypothetical protein
MTQPNKRRHGNERFLFDTAQRRQEEKEKDGNVSKRNPDPDPDLNKIEKNWCCQMIANILLPTLSYDQMKVKQIRQNQFQHQHQQSYLCDVENHLIQNETHSDYPCRNRSHQTVEEYIVSETVPDTNGIETLVLSDKSNGHSSNIEV